MISHLNPGMLSVGGSHRHRKRERIHTAKEEQHSGTLFQDHCKNQANVFLKGTPGKGARWHENVENAQIFLDFIWLC